MSRLAEALLAELGPDELAELAERLRPFLSLPHERREDRWLNSAEAAEYLGLSRDALHRLSAERRIPFSQDRPGARCYFRVSDLERWRAAASQ